nr:unnamed protein product [Digitaria exilis]
MNIVRGVADLLRKAPPPPAPGGDAGSGTADAGSSFPAGGHDDAPTPRVVFSNPGALFILDGSRNLFVSRKC